MKRLTLALIAVLTFEAFAARAADPVPYLDWDDANGKMTNATVAENQPTAVTVTSTKQQWPWSELSIDYKCENIPDNNSHAYRIELQYRISSVDEWTTVPAEDYRRPSDWTETVDGLLVHRITNGFDRLTWDVRKTLGTDVNLRDSQVRINVHDLGLGARWDGYDADSPPGLWPARLLDLDLVTGSVTAVLDRPANLDDLKARALAEMVYFYRSQHMLFREVPAGIFKRGDQYWHFGGTAYVGVFRMTGDQYTMIINSTKAGDLNLKQVSLENLRGTGAPAQGEPLLTSPLGKLNDKIASSGWRIDVLPDYAYGQRLLWAGNETCPVTDSSTANEYGDFSSNPAAGSKRPSDWGFYDLVSGQEWTLSTNAGKYGPFGATSAVDAKTQLNGNVNCNTPGTTTRAVRLVLWRMGTSLVTEKVLASDLVPRLYRPGDPARVWLDTRIEREIVGTKAVEISYSGDDWGRGGTGVTVWYSFEGGAAKTLKEASDSGTFEWTPKVNGRYVFSHAVADGATNTAVIVVDTPPGCEIDPWKVGENVTAYIKDGVLYLKGTGAMNDFASAAKVPWAAVADQVTAVTVEDGVTKVGKNALAGIGDDVTVNGTPLSTYRTVSSVETKINGMPLTDYNAVVRRLNVGEEWKEASPASFEPTPAPEPPAGAVTSWDALTNAVVTAESGAVIAVGADITETGGELVVPAGKAVAIKLYGKTVSCGRVTVNGALTVGDAEDSVGRIVATDGAKVVKGGSVTILGGPMRGTFTTLSPGLILLFK